MPRTELGLVLGLGQGGNKKAGFGFMPHRYIILQRPDLC